MPDDFFLMATECPEPTEVAVIVATHRREKLLLERAVESIAQQALQPRRVVVVNDGPPLENSTSSALSARLKALNPKVVQNQRNKGYAGALNTALLCLRAERFRGFVAVIDDDDTWDSNHLSANLAIADATRADAVVSGLRFIRDGELQPRSLIQALKPEDFLCGNPGWQGSNTFVRFARLIEAGGFREGLVSCNDRDLAIRLLRTCGFRLGFTGLWTATWHMERNRPALTHGGSAEKLAGLQGFWSLHGDTMQPERQKDFFVHAENRFGFRCDQILNGPDFHLRLLELTSE